MFGVRLGSGCRMAGDAQLVYTERSCEAPATRGFQGASPISPPWLEWPFFVEARHHVRRTSCLSLDGRKRGDPVIGSPIYCSRSVGPLSFCAPLSLGKTNRCGIVVCALVAVVCVEVLR